MTTETIGSIKKSIEGSLGLIISQLFTILILSFWTGLVDLSNTSNIIIIISFLMATSFVEAFTNDNDNLILPIVAYPFLISLKN